LKIKQAIGISVALVIVLLTANGTSAASDGFAAKLYPCPGILCSRC